jgi:ABC-type multidrug transport system ATPase subunit
LVPGIRDHGKTVLMTTHLMEEAERLCDRVAIIEHGKIIDVGSPGELVGRHCPARTVVLATIKEVCGAGVGNRERIKENQTVGCEV